MGSSPLRQPNRNIQQCRLTALHRGLGAFQGCGQVLAVQHLLRMGAAGARDAGEVRRGAERGQRHDVGFGCITIGVHVERGAAHGIPNAIVEHADQQWQTQGFGHLMGRDRVREHVAAVADAGDHGLARLG